ncbi:MAG: hypothetical protein VB949_16745 [Pseudomonadales bacterium]
MFEIRDYHYRPDLIAEYKTWAEFAVVVLRDKLDVVGFWIDEGEIEPEIAGSAPINSPIGSANVTWIIRWDSQETRNTTMQTAFAGEAWDAVVAKHRDPDGYLQISSRFMEAM